MAKEPWDRTKAELEKLSKEELDALRKRAQNAADAPSYSVSPGESKAKLTTADDVKKAKAAVARMDDETKRRVDITKNTVGSTAQGPAGTVGGQPASGFKSTRTTGPGRNIGDTDVIDDKNPDNKPKFSRDQLSNQLDFNTGTFSLINPDTGDVDPNFAGAVLGGYGNSLSRVTGNPGAGGQVGRSGGMRGNLRTVQGMTVKDALYYLRSLAPNELMKVQFDMFDAGLYGSGSEQQAPVWGVLTDQTYSAFERFVGKALQQKDRTVGEVLSGLQSEAALTRMRLGQTAQTAKETAAQNRRDLVEVPSTEMLSQAVDSVAQELLGSNLSDEQKQSIVAGIQARSKSSQIEAINFDVSGDPTGNTPAGTGEVDAFMTALIGQESGGNPEAVNSSSGAWGIGQIMPAYWTGWAQEAGANPNDRSEANQRKVIRYKLNQYHEAYGNWRDVAIAWYAGGGTVEAMHAGRVSGNGAEDGPTINDYADQVLGRMSEVKAGMGIGVSGNQTLVREQFDAESALRAGVRNANPVAYEGTKYAAKWDAFQRLVGSARSARISGGA